MQISCAFATATDTPRHVALAESLGYRRAWLYDSPAVITDVWMVLTRCAERTTRIGLGPGVLVPSLRHPMVNAAAISELAAQAPGRVSVAVGTGFTGRLALGVRPVPWREVAEYVRCLKTLLAGGTAEWEGAKIRMLQLPGFGAARPIDVPILIAADGPRGGAVAKELGDGIFSVLPPQQSAQPLPSRRSHLVFGTVLDDGENLMSARVVETLASSAVLRYHRVYLMGGAAAVDELPGGRAWREAVEGYPADEQHLAIHLVQPDHRHRPHLERLVRSDTLSGTPAHVANVVARYGAAGITEIVYQPAGPDIERELHAFARAAGLATDRARPPPFWPAGRRHARWPPPTVGG
ncbi:LLM class flavin-dependent oxidoreductase [Mycolicibacterium goodii]|uniref:LLM class flavin-dependent oxidoreductase n=1 Tax=Mycolicibacterium goodii TaxID=134601 RepID=A0ABS6HXT9_MYCGD|nr:LLM class flavin-dependent oxidoreductase [Mycolicibacterium goodii]OKH62965.1 5,10-methylene tetrahydromethanopterin reductase [Mycobacterium sp. SWH-M5]MBU8813143.1 LLM class flavin-dependent oxidoreductase [Mycolicibacterium goodii]MBU8816699.1 LLM class flavin-dependent oxidoreductase [Mycolicibacterium goodii]MBU8826267.1 LLM class flavin-dependent oxidoreductase [Mycolicibacterium goodii]MBU8839640.1 LLM class flavin-dependent oxidoreductase [Mycolicibacterium goodii]